MFPFVEDITRFDFEVSAEDEHLCNFAQGIVNAHGSNL